MASIEQAYKIASEQYAELGVDTEKAMQSLESVAVSLHCWQGDDVGGFESSGEELSGGIAVTGAYPGKARTPDELRTDLEMAYSLLPGKHRLNLHAFYAEMGDTPVERSELGPEHFRSWIDWAKSQQLGMDFNPTFF
ncbi:MAG: L-rhamnose isomerase, partial [Planctomycetota bacterium]